MVFLQITLRGSYSGEIGLVVGIIGIIAAIIRTFYLGHLEFRVYDEGVSVKRWTYPAIHYDFSTYLAYEKIVPSVYLRFIRKGTERVLVIEGPEGVCETIQFTNFTDKTRKAFLEDLDQKQEQFFENSFDN